MPTYPSEHKQWCIHIVPNCSACCAATKTTSPLQCSGVRLSRGQGWYSAVVVFRLWNIQNLRTTKCNLCDPKRETIRIDPNYISSVCAILIAIWTNKRCFRNECWNMNEMISSLFLERIMFSSNIREIVCRKYIQSRQWNNALKSGSKWNN